MKKLLITRTAPNEVYENLEEKFEVIMPDKEKEEFTYDEIVEKISDVDVILASLHKIDKEVIDAGKNLKVIANLGVGFDNIDWKYATEKKIPVINTPITVTEATSELGIALMLTLMRNIIGYDKDVREKQFCTLGAFYSPATRAYGRTLGIIGFGRIGKSIAKKALALGMEVIYYDPFRAAPEIEKEYQAKFMPFEEVLKTADVITMHLPYMPETHHIIGKKEFEMMKKNAFFINIARGPVVDEAELIEALRNHVIKGAGIDVYEYEPKVSAGLVTLDNIVLTPHVGTLEFSTRVEMAHESLNGALAVLKGEIPYNCINKEVFKK